MKFIMLINVKMPTTFGVLIFNSRIDAVSESFKAIKFLFSVYYFEISCSVGHENKTLEAISHGGCLAKLV